MTIEEKAKAYDETIEKLRNFYRDYDIVSNLIDVKKELANLIPELKENEGEMIRKALTEYFHDSKKANIWCNGFSPDSILDWLKKQVPADENKIVKGIRRGIAISLINHFDANSKGMCLSNMECEDIENAIINEDWDKVYDYMKKKLEKQGVQKPADKIEPKFKVGDKIIEKDFNECGCGTIIGIKDGKYIFDNGGFICIEEQGLWKLVEQNSAWSKEDEHKIKDIVYFLDTAKKHYASIVELDACIDWLKSLKDKVHPKQEWSEEDSYMLRQAIKCVNNYGKIEVSTEEIEEWLKSLRPQEHYPLRQAGRVADPDMITIRNKYGSN